MAFRALPRYTRAHIMGRIALVTGASAGIGEAFARELARDGFDLVLVARRAERLQTLASTLEAQLGIKAYAIPLDLADPAAPEQLMAELARRNLSVDVLVNNAGSGIANTYAQTDWRVHAQLLQVQVTAVAQLTWLCLPAMLERGYGRIIHVASLAGLLPGAPTSTLYPAAKSFLVRFAESLACELEGTGVHVCAVCPGFTRTEFHDVMGTRGVVAKLPGFLWQDAQSVAAEGVAAVMRNDVVYVTGHVNRLLAGLMRHLAPPWARGLMRSRAKHFRAVDTAQGSGSA
jgi:short-subunit dehydrogenase